MDKKTIITGLLLASGIGIAGYVVYGIYKKAVAADVANSAPKPNVVIPVQPFSSAKPKPKKVLRVV